MLINKDKGRPAWSPSELSDVDSNWARTTFFDPRKSDYVRNAPRLSPSGRTDADMDIGFWALPRERSVRANVVGEAKDSGANALNLEQLVAKFEKRKDGKKGVRAKIEEIVSRCCEVQEGSWLKWKA